LRAGWFFVRELTLPCRLMPAQRFISKPDDKFGLALGIIAVIAT
jgi:hypothetical protein